MPDVGGGGADNSPERTEPSASTNDPITASLLEQIASPDDRRPNFDGIMEPLGEVFDLSTPEAWIALSQRIKSTRPRESNMNAWRRCLAIMRHNSARTVVFEHHYVCLEYRSEFVTFYAHVDKSVPTVASRLHFFGEAFGAEHLGRLEPDQIKSYLGYIVVRPANLPIVGRAHMKAPDFVEISTAVSDKVHLFGQSLEVVGVPFMEQESRMAQCGNVALWMIHHTAFLRGIFERKFIADFVDMPGNRWPMRVSSPRGIEAFDAAKILDDVGFHSDLRNADERWLPPPSDWSDIVQSATRSPDENEEADRRAVNAFQEASDLVDQILLDAFEDRPLEAADWEALNLYNRSIIEQLKPHIQSGFPVYIGTNDHALVACGFDREGRVVVHDDQFGPYLTANRVTTLSRPELNAQTPRARRTSEILGADQMSFDQWWDHSRSTVDVVSRSGEIDRAGLDFIFAEPPRVFQRLGSARVAGMRRLQTSLGTILGSGHAPSDLLGDLVPVGSAFPDVATHWQESTMLVKGITYKESGRQRGVPSDPLCEAMSWVQLSEWVIVVELITEILSGSAGSEHRIRHCVGEIVYDSSSDPLHPRVLVLRVGNRAVFRQPGDRLFEISTGPNVIIEPFVDAVAARGLSLR